MGNPQCIVISDVFQVIVDPGPAIPTIACWETATLNAATCTWDVTGTQPLPPALSCYETLGAFNTTSCIWDVAGTQPKTVIEKNLGICDGNELRLQPQTSILNPSYLWSTGEFTEEIIVDSTGVFTVDIAGDFCSFETIIYNVVGPEAPIIESVVSNGNEIIITSANPGDFLYSLDGFIFQSGNIFYDVKGGLYTIYVKNHDCDITINKQHLHFYIPKFFTPNNDGINDTFRLEGIEIYSTSQVAIFDRYGKLLKFARNDVSFAWDGNYNNLMMPSGDYWYTIIIEEQKFTGHFALKR